MSFPFQEALTLADHLLAAGFSFFFALASACVCGGSVFTLVAKFHGSESMDPRWDELALRCAKTTRALAGWVACPLGLGLWVVTMAQRPRMMEQLHSIFITPALLGLLLFLSGFCFLGRYIALWGRGSHESRLHFVWGLLSVIGFWCAAAVLVSVCAFSIHTGGWVAEPGLSNAFWNPTFPSVFVTWAAISVLAFGAFGLLYAATRKDGPWRVALVHELGKWMVAGAVIGVLGWIWWGIRLPGGTNQQWVFWLMAVAVAAQAAMGGIAYRWGVRDPERRHRWHAGAASVLVVLLMVACGWVYVEAKGNFQIQQYMYRNGMIIEEAEISNRAGLWNFVNLGEPLPAQEELGAFSFRAQCMACHENWVKSEDPSRTPRFRFEGDALRFLGEIGSKHPPYPLFAGTPEERRALAAYLEAMIAKSGRTLASRPEPPPATQKPAVRPAMVPKTSTRGVEKRAEVPKSNMHEVQKETAPEIKKEIQAAAKAQGTPEVKEKSGTTISPDLSKAAQSVKKSQEQEQAGSAVSSTRSRDISIQDAKISKKEGAVSIAPSGPPSTPQGAKKPEEKSGVLPVSPSQPDDGQDAKGAQDAKKPPEEDSGVTASPAPSNAAQDADSKKSQDMKKSDEGRKASTAPSGARDDRQDAGSLQDIGISEKPESAASSPAPSIDAKNNKSPDDGESVSAAPSSVPSDPQDAKKPEEKNSP